jgi:hypothetical protein
MHLWCSLCLVALVHVGASIVNKYDKPQNHFVGKHGGFKEPPTKPSKCVCRQCCSTCYQLDYTCQNKCPVCTTAMCPIYCSGPSSGCLGDKRWSEVVGPTASGSWGGCYGEDQGGVGGECVCATGEFANPEIYSIAGALHNLGNGESVKIQCISGISGSNGITIGSRFRPDEDNAMSVTATKNGRFEFPYKLAPNRNYDVTVEESPPGKLCEVTLGTGRYNPVCPLESNTRYLHFAAIVTLCTVHL